MITGVIPPCPHNTLDPSCLPTFSTRMTAHAPPVAVSSFVIVSVCFLFCQCVFCLSSVCVLSFVSVCFVFCQSVFHLLSVCVLSFVSVFCLLPVCFVFCQCVFHLLSVCVLSFVSVCFIFCECVSCLHLAVSQAPVHSELDEHGLAEANV